MHPGEIIFQGISSAIQHNFEIFVLEVFIRIYFIVHTSRREEHLLHEPSL